MMDFTVPRSDWYDRFIGSPYSLRFELGGEEFYNITQSVPRFVQAFDRARRIADYAFTSTTPLLAIVGFWTLEKGEFFYGKHKGCKTGLDILKMTGFDGGVPVAEWRAKLPWINEDEDCESVDWAVFDLSNNKVMRDVLIWCAITREMPIQPTAPIAGYLYNPATEVMMDIYDDRGLDVKALAATALNQAYRDFDNWLLDYDRPRMAEAFAPAPTG